MLDLQNWIEVDKFYDEDIALKRSLLSERRDRVFVSTPQGDAGSSEVLDELAAYLPIRYPERWAAPISVDSNLHPLEAASLLVQEDLCLMTQQGQDWVLTAGSICFPSRWDPRDKIGKSLLGIHEPVPHYVEKIGVATQSLFDKMTVDRPMWRVNWTIMDTPDLHQPVPVRRADSITVTKENLADHLYFRRERQTLRKFPKTGDLLFTIRTYTNTLAQAAADFPEFRANLVKTLSGATPEMVDYKGWVNVINDMQDWSADGIRDA
ncbi:MAG: DUF3445 domain-containing protein [Actinomycetes bacterium]